ncbi:MAG: hypothetical protein EOM64_09750, partial [Erysipelotrichia bacterium]|nr:hypothetical protein [Erysipelotrichia bacterium]
MDWLFLALISAVLLFGLLPRSSYLSFRTGTEHFGSSSGNDDSNGDIISITGTYDKVTREGNSRISLKGSGSSADTVTLRTTTKDYTAFFDFGFENAGGVSTNAQDSEYLSRATLEAFEVSSYIDHPNNPYFMTSSFSDLVSRYIKDGYCILFAVKGDSTIGWDDDMQQKMESLGFDYTPANGGRYGSFIGYTYQGEAWSTGSDHSSAAWKTIGSRRFYLSSAGIYSGNKSMVKLENKELSSDENGICVIAYDIENDQLIDSVVYHTNTENPSMSRADRLFYTEYVTQYRSALLEQARAYTGVFYQFQAVVCIIFAFMLNLLRIDLKNVKKFAEGNIPLKKWYLIRRQIGLSFLCVLAAGADTGLGYLLNEFNGVTIDQLLFHMNTNLNGTNWSDFNSLFCSLAVRCGIALAVSLLWSLLMHYVILKKTSRRKLTVGLSIRWSAVMCTLLSLFLTIQCFWNSFYVNDFLAAQQFNSILYEKYYVDTANAEIEFPEEKKNLIFIFMESMEISAADEISGGGKSFNAIPELTDLALKYDNFNGDSDKLNGAI